MEITDEKQYAIDCKDKLEQNTDYKPGTGIMAAIKIPRSQGNWALKFSPVPIPTGEYRGIGDLHEMTGNTRARVARKFERRSSNNN